jgi:hypothetical protein
MEKSGDEQNVSKIGCLVKELFGVQTVEIERQPKSFASESLKNN